MTEQEFDNILMKMVRYEFYTQNFCNNQDAVKYLGITVDQLQDVLYELNETLDKFICTMRLEEVLDILVVAPKTPYSQLAVNCGFDSRLHLLWCFFIRYRCTPRQWVVDQGLLP